MSLVDDLLQFQDECRSLGELMAAEKASADSAAFYFRLTCSEFSQSALGLYEQVIEKYRVFYSPHDLQALRNKLDEIIDTALFQYRRMLD